MKRHKFCKGIIFLVMILLLISCFDKGLNQGSNQLLINGSVLKGQFRFADLLIYDNFERLIWQQYTNEHGEFSAIIPGNVEGVYKIISTANQDSTMVCDATECFINDSTIAVDFGDEIQANELGDIEIKSIAFFSNDNQVKQLNALTSLTFERFTDMYDDNISEVEFNRLAISASHITALSLGFLIAQDINLLNLNMLDITKKNSLINAGEYEIIFSLINASMAKDLNHLNSIANITQNLIASPGSLELQKELETIQKTLLKEVQDLIASDDINVTNADVIQSINLAATTPLNFSAFNDAISDHQFYTNNDKISVSDISVSSTYWAANTRKKDTWWWGSAINRGKLESLEFELQQPSKVGAFSVGFSHKYQGKNLQIQGFNEYRQWVSLSVLDSESFNAPDLKNVIHYFDRATVDDGTYSHLRLLSAPTTSLWLEYLCFFLDESDFSSSTSPCSSDNKIKVISTNTVSSSNLFAPENIMSKNLVGEGSWWLSEMATGENEWIMLKYNQQFIATSMNLTIHQHNVGDEVEIQASNDAQNWQTLLTISADHYQYEPSDEQGFITLALPLDNDQSFLFYRYFSKPSAFLWIEHLTFN